jgi:serine protease Do
LASLVWVSPAAARLTADGFSELAGTAGPAVVNIRAEKTVSGGPSGLQRFGRDPFGREDPFDFFERFFQGDPEEEFTERSLGSGFLIGADGLIVTNNHVVAEADAIQVRLNSGAEYDAEIVGRDPSTDLALIRIPAEGKLPFLKLGDSEALRVGQWVMAIGNPFGLEHTVTAGIVSAKGRVIGSGPYDDFIQTDASINPGNSGGPLLDLSGRVVGINTAIVAGGRGIGFAVPIDMARGVIDQLREDGEVTRGWLGVAIQDLTPELARYYGVNSREGVLITQTFPGDPADEAGLRPRDIIVSVNDAPVEQTHELTRRIADLEVGASARIGFLRNGERRTATVTIARRDEERIAKGLRPVPDDGEAAGDDGLGIAVAELTEAEARRRDIPHEDGVLVTAVSENGPAAAAGLMEGDVVKEVNHAPVPTPADFRRALSGAPRGEPIRLFVRRPDRGFRVVTIDR